MPITNSKVLNDVYDNVISEFSDMRYGSFLNLVEDGDINIFENREDWWSYRSEHLEYLIPYFDGVTLESSEQEVYDSMDDDGNIREYKGMIIELF